jgi:hypothetical protein
MFASKISESIIKASSVLSELNIESDDYLVPNVTPEIVTILEEYISFNYPLPQSIYNDEILLIFDELMIDSTKLITNTIMYGNPKQWGKLLKYRIVENKKSFIKVKKMKNSMLFDKPRDMWCIYAAQFGYLECLKHAYENGCPLRTTDLHAAVKAAEFGNLECLIYITEHEHELEKSPSVILSACKHGNIDCIKYAHSKGYPINNYAIKIIIEYNQIECLYYLIQNGCPLLEQNILQAIKNNRTECIKLLLNSPCPRSVRCIEYASKLNKLEYVKILHENGILFSPYVFINMINNKNMEAISYLCEMNCPVNNHIIPIALCYGIELMMYLHSKIDFSTVNNLDIYTGQCIKAECYKFLLDNGYVWDPIYSRCLLNDPHNVCVQVLIANGYQLHPKITYYAAKYGNIECLQILNRHGYTWTAGTATYAAKYNLKCLQFLHTYGCPIDNKVTYYAAKHGNINCLIYAHKTLGCALFCPKIIEDEYSFNNSKKMECYRYVLDNGGIILSKKPI